MGKVCLITFHSTHHALKAEKVLKSSGIGVDVIPIPREFSSNCGIAMSVAWEEKEEAIAVLNKNNVQVEAIHGWERG